MDSEIQIFPQSSVVRHLEGGINEMSKVFGKIWEIGETGDMGCCVYQGSNHSKFQIKSKLSEE